MSAQTWDKGKSSHRRKHETVRFLLFFFAFFLPLAAAQAQTPETQPYPGKFVGLARVADGDSLWIGGEEMRLLCIDAVELHQTCADAKGKDYPCGQLAKQAMKDLIGDAEVACYGHERDKYNRPLVYCHANGINLNEAMAEKGWAIALCKSMKPIVAKAREKGLGIWQGRFEPPPKWRKEHPWHK
jgi:endonuclease YncB( thermonuclease family)